MKNLILRSLFVVLIPFIYSCGGKGTLSMEKKEFKENSWPKFEPVEFTFESSGTQETYYIALKIGYMQLFSGTELPLVCTLTSPSGEIRVMQNRFWLKSLNGTHKGVQTGSVWIASAAIWPEIELREKGQYSLEIVCDHPKMVLVGVASMQVEIKKGKFLAVK